MSQQMHKIFIVYTERGLKRLKLVRTGYIIECFDLKLKYYCVLDENWEISALQQMSQQILRSKVKKLGIVQVAICFQPALSNLNKWWKQVVFATKRNT